MSVVGQIGKKGLTDLISQETKGESALGRESGPAQSLRFITAERSKGSKNTTRTLYSCPFQPAYPKAMTRCASIYSNPRRERSSLSFSNLLTLSSATRRASSHATNSSDRPSTWMAYCRTIPATRFSSAAACSTSSWCRTKSASSRGCSAS